MTEETGRIGFPVKIFRACSLTVRSGGCAYEIRVYALFLFALVPDVLAGDDTPHASRLPAGCEVVMLPGMRISASTSVGKITVTAVDDLTRAYHWDGADPCRRDGTASEEVARKPRLV